MSTTAHTHTAPPDPLSQPRAAFNGHHVNVRSYNNGNYNHSSEPDGGRELSGGAWQSEGDQEVHDAASQADYSSWNEDLKPMRLEPSSPRVNPFHLLSQPNSDSALPPLPPHLQRLVASADHSEDPPVAPFHVTKVTEEYVKVKTGPYVEVAQPKRMMNKVSQAFKRSDGDTIIVSSIPNGHGEQNGKPELSSPALSATGPIMQGPPPSPPISEGEVEQDESESSHALSDHVFETSSVHSGPPLSPLTEVTEVTTITTPSLYTSSLTAEPSDLAASPIKTSSTSTPVKPPHLTVPTQRRVSSGSATSRTGSLAVVRANRLAQQRNTSSPVGSQDDGTRVVDVSDEGDMENKAGPSRQANPPPAQPRTQPLGTPVTPQPRVSRRNTNPNPPVGPAAFPPRSPLMHTQSTLSVSPSLRSRTMVPGLDGSALDSDILAHAEEIRRERLERKQKKASAADAVPEPTADTAEKKPEAKREETKVLVGNLIGEDHVNYVLMYNMLTGIRIGVSRCQAKIKRPLTDEDYTARHKFSFDVVGNELTPSARYDFKFKDYAPWIFRDLRDEHFHLDPADYLLSLTAKYILSELGSPGKSGSFFYFSRDYRFIIKTISHSEHKFLRSILKDYHEHVKANPHTLLSRFYGLHRVKLPRGRKIHFVIMNNLFPPHRDIHETYDLKGSAYGREYDEEKAKVNPKAVLKDKNWVNRNRTLELGPEKRALLTEQLRRDMEFLKKMKVMDYSLLVGIHNMERGNRDNLRENQLSVFHPEVMQSRRKPSANKGPSEASNVRKAIRRSDPKMLDAASQLPNEDSADRRHFLFYQDEGGLRATDEQNQSMDVIYYLGVIDICTPYNTAKKIEHFWKSMTEDRLMISCIDPNHYGQRFLNFMMSVMRGGDPALRPPGLQSENEQQEERPVGSDQDKIKNESSLPQNPLMPSPRPHSPIHGQFSQMPVAAEPEEIASSSPRTEPAHLRAE